MGRDDERRRERRRSRSGSRERRRDDRRTARGSPPGPAKPPCRAAPALAWPPPRCMHVGCTHRLRGDDAACLLTRCGGPARACVRAGNTQVRGARPQARPRREREGRQRRRAGRGQREAEQEKRRNGGGAAGTSAAAAMPARCVSRRRATPLFRHNALRGVEGCTTRAGVGGGGGGLGGGRPAHRYRQAGGASPARHAEARGG